MAKEAAKKPKGGEMTPEAAQELLGILPIVEERLMMTDLQSSLKDMKLRVVFRVPTVGGMTEILRGTKNEDENTFAAMSRVVDFLREHIIYARTAAIEGDEEIGEAKMLSEEHDKFQSAYEALPALQRDRIQDEVMKSGWTKPFMDSTLHGEKKT